MRIMRAGRVMAGAGLTLLAGGAAAGPVAAAPVFSPVPAATAGRPPLVTDAQPAVATKRGLSAPVMSRAMQRANDRKQATATKLLQLMGHRMGPDVKCSSPACLAGLPAAAELAGTQQPQDRSYYCGPATVSEMLGQLGVRLSQSAAARELHTSTNGTDWSDSAGYPVLTVLNQNQTRNRYVAVALPWDPSVRQTATYETDLIVDINDNGGVPLAGNAYEIAGGPHLASNPVNQTIMHWIDIRGYRDYGAITDYEDSVHDASSVSWALTVPAYSAISSAVMADILGARGYDW